ncbi:hypothetical protein NA78x_000711 [Anatilimnocola sp. NA78]|uniref:hypothetical protein n=1 Tax=Anatilimnocola sp. NA78 TaxID=3415683 RepID=UPI003CE48D47
MLSTFLFQRSRWAISLASVTLVCGLIATPAFGQAPTSGGWKMPNLNPFAGKSGPATGRVSDKPLVPDGINPFKLLPGSAGKTSNSSYQKPQQPSTWQKVTKGTKKAAAQTADFLNPFNDGQPEVQEQSVTGSNSLFNQHANARASKPGTAPGTNRSWFPGWGGGKTPDSKPKSVNEFLSSPRPN